LDSEKHIEMDKGRLKAPDPTPPSGRGYISITPLMLDAPRSAPSLGALERWVNSHGPAVVVSLG